VDITVLSSCHSSYLRFVNRRYCKVHVHGYKCRQLEDESRDSHISFCVFSNYHIQGDLGKKVYILGGDNTGHDEKELHMNTCLILNGYQNIAL